MIKQAVNLLLVLFVIASVNVCVLRAQDASIDKAKDEKKKDEKKDRKKKDDKSKKSESSATISVGGREHDAEILGVKIGMDVPTALQAVFVNAERKAGEEKPDAQRKEGKNGKDIRVMYKSLPQGDLQIVFAEGKIVREVALNFAKPPNIDDLRLPYSGDIGIALGGDRFDDRYSVGFTDSQKLQRIWWRDEKTPQGFGVRVQFFSPDKIKDAGAKFVVTAVQKLLYVMPGDEAKFTQAFSLNKK
jgi:hypothetical protein